MMRAAQEAGFANTLLFYNRYHGDLARYAGIVRESWPWLDCEIAPVGGSITGFDACVASSWPTAHVLANRASAIPVIYFIQDYEPYFYPRGDIYAFAEDSYRFGFRNVALGPMIHHILQQELGVHSDLVPYGGDTTKYHLKQSDATRSGVAFYAKPSNPRRGFHLAVRALRRFHELHPNQMIHAYGDTIGSLPFPVVNHGRLSVEGLVGLYNSVITGLTLSFTNVSLVPEELLACGAIPVVNETAYAHAVLDNPNILWARATPSALAQALSEAVSRPNPDQVASIASRSVSARSWDETERAIVRILSDETGASLA